MFALARLVALAAVATASCAKNPTDYHATAGRIGEVGQVPPQLKLAAAKMLVHCRVPIEGRYIYFHWEGGPGTVPYTLELARDQFENASIRACLDAQARALSVHKQIDLGEEAPSPPRT